MLYEYIDEYAKFAYNGCTHPNNSMERPDKILLADELTWRAIVEPALCQDAAGVEALARLLFTLKRAIDSGPEGAMRASQTLLSGIEQIYLYTDAHKAALKLYVLSLEGNLEPHDEPLQLINGAFERAAGHASQRLRNR